MTEPDSKPYEEEFGKRFVVDFQRMVFKLSAALGKDGEPTDSAGDRTENVSHNVALLTLLQCPILPQSGPLAWKTMRVQ